MQNRQYFVYIMTNKWDTVFYIGITNNLLKRTWEHKQKEIEGFTKKYNLTKLVYYEIYNEVYEAISREKQLKRWSRKKKVDLIKRQNPKFKDLFEGINY